MGKRGQRLRPCDKCGAEVNFVLWEDATKERNRRIFHWANVDGSHHVCNMLEKRHLWAIMKDGA